MLARKTGILFFTLLYSMVLLHNSIYHHHHETAEQAVLHHQHEHSDHKHTNGESGGHDHTPHFVHSSDFGISLNTSFSCAEIKVLAFTPARPLHLPAAIIPDNLPAQHIFLPDNSPPLCSGYHMSGSLRGPPSFIS
jgi:hypothetical protein